MTGYTGSRSSSREDRRETSTASAAAWRAGRQHHAFSNRPLVYISFGSFIMFCLGLRRRVLIWKTNMPKSRPAGHAHCPICFSADHDLLPGVIGVYLSKFSLDQEPALHHRAPRLRSSGRGEAHDAGALDQWLATTNRSSRPRRDAPPASTEPGSRRPSVRAVRRP